MTVNVNKLIKDTLKPLNIPIEFQAYSGKEKTYITFFCYNEQGEVYAENQEIMTSCYFQVDLWSDKDYLTFTENIRLKMETAGFKRTSSADFFEKDTKVYHKAMRFIYTK